MKKVLIALAIVALATTGAQAMPINFRVNADALPEVSAMNYGISDAFEQLGIFADTTSTHSTPTSFSDVGEFYVHSLMPSTFSTNDVGYFDTWAII